MSTADLREFLENNKFCPLCKNKVGYNGFSYSVNNIVYLTGKKYIQINLKTNTALGISKIQSFDVSCEESEDQMLSRLFSKNKSAKTGILQDLAFVCKTCPTSDKKWSQNPEMISYFRLHYDLDSGLIVKIEKEYEKFWLYFDQKLFELVFYHPDKNVKLRSLNSNLVRKLNYNSFNFDKISSEYLLSKIKTYLLLE